MMKKILTAAVSAVISLTFSIAAFASDLTVTVKNNDQGAEPVTYTYDTEKTAASVDSIKSLMTKLGEVTKNNSAVQTLTLFADGNEGDNITFKLRISLPEKDASSVMPEKSEKYSEDEYSSLDYYNIEITDGNGDKIYSYSDGNEDKYDTYKEIPLGSLSLTDEAVSKILNITVSQNKSLTKESVMEAAQNLDFSIVSEAAANENSENEEEDEKTVSEPITLGGGEYLCGEDIQEGRYTATGSGKLRIYADDGALKSVIILKNTEDGDGVYEYSVNLIDGEKIEIEKSVTFTPYNASETSKTKPAPAQASETDSSQSNPESANGELYISIVMAALAAVIGVFILIERKKS